MTSRLVGKPTAKPIAHPLTNLCRNPAVQPVIIDVIVKVIVEFIASVINIAMNNIEYFLSNFIILNQSHSHFSTIKTSFLNPASANTPPHSDTEKALSMSKMQLSDWPFRAFMHN
jgi:hypothetical protein